MTEIITQNTELVPMTRREAEAETAYFRYSEAQISRRFKDTP